MDKDEFLINILLNGFRMPLKIPRIDEEIYRNAEKIVNKYLDQYRKQYNQLSMEEILTIVAYQLAVIVAKLDLNNDVAPLAERVVALNDELKELFEKQ